jgi:hypothetical protein
VYRLATTQKSYREEIWTYVTYISSEDLHVHPTYRYAISLDWIASRPALRNVEELDGFSTETEKTYDAMAVQKILKRSYKQIRTLSLCASSPSPSLRK